MSAMETRTAAANTGSSPLPRVPRCADNNATAMVEPATSNSSTGVGTPVGEAVLTAPLCVQGLVQGLEVQPRSGCGRCHADGVGRNSPQLTLELGAVGDGIEVGIAARNRLGDANAGIGESPEEIERLLPIGLGERLGPQIRRSYRVCFGHHGSASSLVALHGQAEAERDDEPHEADQGGLNHPERLAQAVRTTAEPPPDHETECRGTHDQGKEGRRQRPRAQLKEEHDIVTPPQHRGSPGASSELGSIPLVVGSSSPASRQRRVIRGRRSSTSMRS